jgi:putative endonuclease
MYCVYILQCCDGTYYTGCTNNLERRVKQHSVSKLGAKYTRIRRPVSLVHKEEYETLSEARAREAAIKRLRKEQKEKLFKNS